MKVHEASRQRIRDMWEAGYTACACGAIFNPDGKMISNPKSSWRTLTTSYNKKSYTVLAHRFCAYVFFGEEALQAECVRHLNDKFNDNSKWNLAPGTYKDNSADKLWNNPMYNTLPAMTRAELRRVRTWLARQERSKAWLARKVGISRQLLQHYFQGTCAMPDSTWRKIRKMMG